MPPAGLAVRSGRVRPHCGVRTWESSAGRVAGVGGWGGVTATRGRPLPVRPRLAGVADGVTTTRGRGLIRTPVRASGFSRSAPNSAPARSPHRPTNMQTPGRTRSLTSLAEPRPRVSLPNGPPGPCLLPLVWGVRRSPGSGGGGGGDRGTEPRLHRVFQWLPCGPQEASWPDMCAPPPQGSPQQAHPLCTRRQLSQLL